MEYLFTKFIRSLLPLLMILAFTGCVNVKLIAEYDSQIDQSVTEFQKKTEEFLIKMERKIGKPEASYESNVQFYDDMKIILSGIQVRANAIPKNEKTIEMLKLLSENLDKLESAHKMGLKANDILPARSAMNIGCTAILKLELAKRRGVEDTPTK